MSEYAEFLPRAALRADVLCLWQQKITGGTCEYAHRVLPDGCVDVVLIDDEAPAVVGPWTEAFLANLRPGTGIVGARFHPGRAARMLGVPASEFLNQSVAVRDFWRRGESERLLRVAEAQNLAAKRSTLELALLTRLGAAGAADSEVTAAIYWLARCPAGRVEQLSRWVGMSGRQLQRRFCAAVGYGPKMFQSVLRFQRLLHRAAEWGQGGLAEMAVESGYADQSHMNREVQRFSGVAPTALLAKAACTLRQSSLITRNGG